MSFTAGWVPGYNKALGKVTDLGPQQEYVLKLGLVVGVPRYEHLLLSSSRQSNYSMTFIYLF